MAWDTVQLGEVSPAKTTKNRHVSSEEVVWQLNLDQVEAHSGKILSKYYAPVGEAGNSTHWFDERHVLYSKLRPYLNKVVLPDEPGIATTELMPLLPDEKRLDRKYLAYYLRSNSFVNWISSQVSGAKMPRVSMKVFWEHEIPLPPLKEQKRIAAILDKADGLRHKRQQAIQLADEFLRSVFLDMFGAKKKMPRKHLSELVESIEYGLTASAKKDHDGPKFLRITDLQGGAVDWDDVPYCDCSAAEENKYQLKTGDIVFARTGATTGKSFLVWNLPERSVFASYLIRVRPSEELDSVYISAFFKSSDYWAQVAAMSQGAAQPGINGSKLKELLIPLPSKSDQLIFRHISEKVRFIQHELEMAIKSNEELFASLSQKAFSGAL